ncbi:MAG: aldo/keto reductase [Syntrophobacteraceae bacterium]
MEIRPLGKSGLFVPTIGMGTWRTFDVRGEAAIANSRSVVNAAMEAGATFFDSSPMYGEAERVLGLALKGRRDAVQIATKVWADTASQGWVQARRSLSFFGSRIELYQIHNLLNWKEHLEMIERLRDEGRVLAIGATHYSSLSFFELRRVMESGRIAAIQIPYNIEQREVENNILPLAADLGLGVVIMRPVGGGGLLHRAPSTEELMPLKPFGVNIWSQALLKWILSDPRCHVAIPATSSIKHMKENAAAGDPPWFNDGAREYVLQLAQKH